MTPRRKRLLIALAAVLALTGGFWWLTRPVIDPRLVGMWSVHIGEYEIYHQFQFNADGTGTVVARSGGQPFHIVWGMNSHGQIWSREWFPNASVLSQLVQRWEGLWHGRRETLLWTLKDWGNGRPIYVTESSPDSERRFIRIPRLP
jgi:hypothetical protein